MTIPEAPLQDHLPSEGYGYRCRKMATTLAAWREWLGSDPPARAGDLATLRHVLREASELLTAPQQPESSEKQITIPRALALTTWAVLSEAIPCAHPDCKCTDDATKEQCFAEWGRITAAPQQPESVHLTAPVQSKGALSATPAAQWRVNGEPDPHGNRYECERAALCMGDLSDDELANAVYLHGDRPPPIQDVIAGKAHMPIAYLTAAKDRIRWLSRKLMEASDSAAACIQADTEWQRSDELTPASISAPQGERPDSAAMVKKLGDLGMDLS